MPPPVNVTVAELAIRLVSSLPLPSVMVPLLVIVPARSRAVLSWTVMLPRLVIVFAVPSSVPFWATTEIPLPLLLTVPPDSVLCRYTLLPAARMVPPPLLSIADCMTRPPAPVDSISPLLMVVLPVLTYRALLPVASMVASFTRFSAPTPIWPAPDMVLLRLTSVSPAIAP